MRQGGRVEGRRGARAALAVSAIAIVSSGVAVAATSAAASGRAGTARGHASCRLSAAAPSMANDHVTGKGSIRCRTSRTVHVHIETQTRQLGQWGTFGSFDDPYLQVQAGKSHQVSTGPANCAGLGNVTMRTVLRLVSLKDYRRVLVSVRSRTVEISCSGHGGPSSNASCDPQPQSPVSTNGHITASGTVRCSVRATLAIDLRLQVYFNGGWEDQAFASRGNFDAAANTTYSFTTSPPTACSAPQPGAPPPPPEQYRAQMTVNAGRAPITKTSPVVVLTTC